MKHSEECGLHYDREHGECTCGVAEREALQARIATLEAALGAAREWADHEAVGAPHATCPEWTRRRERIDAALGVNR